MKPIEFFRFCPSCGQGRDGAPSGNSFQCARCGFVYYFNPAIAAAAFILDEQGRVLFIRRAKDPGQGKLAVPGGFIDATESAETALAREIREEVNLELEAFSYLCSQPNEYPYKRVTYSVLDFFFVAKARGTDAIAALDGVESYCWLDPSEVRPDDIAFASMRAALQVFLHGFKRRTARP